MAESPRIWNRLAASLAVCDLTNPNFAWAFLVVQGLVRDEPGDREAFAGIATREANTEITGPTPALRTASQMERAGLALPEALTPDPFAVFAIQRLQIVESWRGRATASDGRTATEQIKDLQEYLRQVLVDNF